MAEHLDRPPGPPVRTDKSLPPGPKPPPNMKPMRK